jgi:hypothetical protein
MSIYNMDKLMSETRRLAAEYRRATGQTLPVSADLANHDAVRLLQMEKPEPPISGVDAIFQGLNVQIKGRVLFTPQKKGLRIGQLNASGLWQAVILVVFNDNYEPQTIFQASRESLQETLENTSKNSRGAITLERFKALSEIVWSASNAEKRSQIN